MTATVKMDPSRLRAEIKGREKGSLSEELIEKDHDKYPRHLQRIKQLNLSSHVHLNSTSLMFATSFLDPSELSSGYLPQNVVKFHQNDGCNLDVKQWCTFL